MQSGFQPDWHANMLPGRVAEVFTLGMKFMKRSDASLPGFRAAASDRAAQNFTMPALSPTMTEGNIAKWNKKEGKQICQTTCSGRFVDSTM